MPLVKDPRGASSQKSGQPTKQVGRETGGAEIAEKERVIHAIEGFRQIDGGDHSPQRRLPLIEAFGDLGGDRKQRSSARTAFGETMLEGCLGEVREEEGADEFFEEFGSGAEEGDGAVGRARVRGFIGFEDREDNGLFPDSGEVCRLEGKVVERGEVGDS